MKTLIKNPEQIILVSREFNPDVAKDVGVDAAIIFQNIIFWIGKNRANNKHFYDDSWWTYNTQRAFGILFPWLTRQRIRTCLNNLEEKNYIQTGSYNRLPYDRTTWYSVGEHPIGQIYHFHWLEPTIESGSNQPLRVDEINQPIPNDNTDDNSVRERAHSPTTEEKRQTYAQIFEACYDHIKPIAKNLKLYESEVEGCVKDMASYYAGNGKFLANPPARLIKWCRDEIKAGKLEVA